MGRTRRTLTSIALRIRWLALPKVALSVIILVSAASVTVTSNNYQAEIGSVTTVASGLPATDKGFNLTSTAISASTSGTTCTTPTIFSSTPSVANNPIAGGHLFYDVRINQTSSATPATKFSVTFALGATTFASLCIQTLATPVNGQIIDCKYDVGTSLPSSPFTFKVTVQ